MSERSSNLAVLIDADNTSHTLIASILEEVAKYGTAYVKHVYGDWSSPALKNWKDKCLSHGLIAIQQFSYTAQKNATDIAMVIDAMDLLHSGKFDGFCLVSSDSDFTGLASRIRKEGVLVYGIGKNNAPEAFRMSCDKYIFTNNLVSKHADDNEDEIKNVDTSDIQNTATPIGQTELRSNTKLISLVCNALRECENETGQAALRSMGSYISKINPEFDSRNYGYPKLSELIIALDIFSFKSHNNQVYISRNIAKKEISRISQIIQKSITQHQKGTQWVRIEHIGKDLKEQNINYLDFGYPKLSEFLGKMPFIEMKENKMIRIKN